MEEQNRRSQQKPWLLVVASFAAALFCLTPWGDNLDHLAYDTLFLIRGEQAVTDDIVFVAIDETSFQEINQPWPWPRSIHAQVIDSMYRAGAKTIAIDILFPEPSTEDEDRALAEVLARGGMTVLGADVNRSEDNRLIVENEILPLDIFRSRFTRVGHVRTPGDADGFVRRTDLTLRGYNSLALEAALAFTGHECCSRPPADELPLINYAGGPGTVKTVSYYQALDAATYLPPDALRDKLVIIGVNTTSSAMPDERRPDHFPTPFTRWGHGYTPGSLVHANVMANLLDDAFIRELPRWQVALGGLLVAILFGLLTLNLSFGGSSLLTFVLALALLYGSYAGFSSNLLYLSPVALVLPLIAVYIFSPYYRYLVEARQRAFIRDAFSTYVNPAIVAQLEKDPESVRLGGKQVDGTALFLDIAGFTDMSERHDPETVVNFINEFLSALIEIAMEAGGTVERFLGDAIMVIWGAPTEQPDHARLACETAIRMAAKIEQISASESERMGTTVHARIGVNSGSMTAGNIGANKRFNYTVLGDCVNLAARLEGLNKVYGTTAIIGSATAEQLGDDFKLRYLDTVTVKGRTTPEKIFEPLGKAGEIAPERTQAAEAYAAGMELYQQGQWEAAAVAFGKGLEANQDDGPCRELQERCRAFAANGPGADWDGVWVVENK